MRVIAAWNSSSLAQSRTFSICLFRRCHLGEVSPTIISQSPTPKPNPLSLRVSPDRDFVFPRSLDGVGRRAPSHLHVVAAYLAVLSPPRAHSPFFWLLLLRCLCQVPPQSFPHRDSSTPICPFLCPSPVIHVQKTPVLCRYLVVLGSGEVHHRRPHPGHLGL